MLVALASLAWDVVSRAFWTMGLLHAVLPGWVEAAGAAAAVYYGSRLRKPAAEDVKAIFGERPRCIGHRGASLDAPENTIAAFKYCVENSCNFVEFDVRSCGSGQLVLLHDADAKRLVGERGPHAQSADWSSLERLDVAAQHPNRDKFGPTRMCTFDEAIDFLIENNMRMIIDVKGQDKNVINGVVEAFSSRPQLYSRAAVTTFNPLVLYQIRRREPRIVGAISYRPYALSYASYDAESGPTQPRVVGGSAVQLALRAGDALMSVAWRPLADWCRVSAVFLHKDIVSPCEVAYWRARGVRTVGWSVNRPLDKLYWRGVLNTHYMASTLVGEPPAEKRSLDIVDSPLPTADQVRVRSGRGAIEELLQEKQK